MTAAGGPPNADFDDDGDIDGADFVTWQRSLGGSAGPHFGPGDSDGDGDVDATDLANWKAAYGAAVAAAGAVPEPAALVVTAFAGAFLAATGRGFHRRRRPQPAADRS